MTAASAAASETPHPSNVCPVDSPASKLARPKSLSWHRRPHAAYKSRNRDRVCRETCPTAHAQRLHQWRTSAGALPQPAVRQVAAHHAPQGVAVAYSASSVRRRALALVTWIPSTRAFSTMALRFALPTDWAIVTQYLRFCRRG